MIAIVFDTLRYAKGAREAGFTDMQAEFQAGEIQKLIESQIATKSDLHEFDKSMRADVRALEQSIQRVDTDIREFKVQIKQGITESEERVSNKVTMRLSSVITVAVAFLTAIHFFSH